MITRYTHTRLLLTLPAVSIAAYILHTITSTINTICMANTQMWSRHAWNYRRLIMFPIIATAAT